MKKILLLLGAIIFVSTIVYLNYPKTLKENIKLKNKIEDVVTSEKSIDFSKEFDSDWDEMIVFPPYGNLESEFKKLKIVSNVKVDTPIEYNDGINFIAFIKNHRIVSYVNNPRDKGDFTINTNKVFSRNHTEFNIIKNDEGRLMFEPKKK